MTPPAAAATTTTAPRRAPQGAPRREPDQPRPPLRVVSPGEARRRNPLAGIKAGRVGTIAGIALFVALFALAAFQTVLIKAQASIDATNAEIEAQETIRRDLVLQRADLSSPERITAAAAALGLRAPGSVTYLQPKPDDAAAAAVSGAGAAVGTAGHAAP